VALDRRWLSIPEAAEVYGLHRKSLYILCKKRLIPFSRIPSLRGGRGQLRIDAKKFDEQLEAGEVVLDDTRKRR
jgi:hypothetical protein